MGVYGLMASDEQAATKERDRTNYVIDRSMYRAMLLAAGTGGAFLGFCLGLIIGIGQG